MIRGVNKIGAVLTIIILAGFAVIGIEQNAQAAQSSGQSVTTPQEQQENAAEQTTEPNFTKARESFLQKNYNAAAAEIRKGIKFMKTQQSLAKAAGKKMLTASINELDALAINIEQGTVTTVNTLDNAFVRARDSIASNAHVKNVQTKTSEAAKETSSGLKQGLSWTGEKISTAASEVAKGTRFIVGKAIEGTGWLGRKTGSMLNSASRKAENLGKEIQPKQTGDSDSEK